MSKEETLNIWTQTIKNVAQFRESLAAQAQPHWAKQTADLLQGSETRAVLVMEAGVGWCSQVCLWPADFQSIQLPLMSGRLKTSPGITCDHSYRIILSWDCGTSSLGWTVASAMSPCLDMLAFLWDSGQRSLQEVSQTTMKLQRIVNGSTSSNSSHPLWWRNMALLLKKSHPLLTKTVAWFSEGRGRDYLTLPTPPGERLSGWRRAQQAPPVLFRIRVPRRARRTAPRSERGPKFWAV